MCSDGISDQEQIAIAAEMSTRLERWTLVTYRQKESIDRDNEVERAHQIIKKHLGETRYLDQAIKCAKSRDAAQVSAVTRGIEYLGAIVGLSAEQRAQTAAIWRKYSRLQGANEISLLDETGRLIQVGNDAALAAEVADESSTGLVSTEDSSLLELSEQFFSLLTPEQQRRYRAFIEENPGGAMSLMGLTIDPPEQIRATMSAVTSPPSDRENANTQE
jgi:hypothetical protein